MSKMDAAVEKEIAKWVVQDLLQAGFKLSVFNGGDEPEISQSVDAVAIVKEMFASDHDHIVAYQGAQRMGMVLLIYGNEGYNVVSNFSMKLAPYYKRAQKLADMIEEDPGFMFQSRDKRMAAVRAAMDADLDMQAALA